MKHKLSIKFIVTLFTPMMLGVALSGEPTIELDGVKLPKETVDVLTDEAKRRLFENSYISLKTNKSHVKQLEQQLENEKDESKKSRLRDLLDFTKKRLVKNNDNHLLLEKKWLQIAREFYQSEIKRLTEELNAAKKQFEEMSK